jgi:hypothetical protein
VCIDLGAVISDSENVHFPDPDDADEPSDFRGWLVLGILALTIVLFVSYFVLPSLIRSSLCPDQTFLSGSTASGAEIFVSFLLLPACFVLIVCTNFEGHDRTPLSARIRRNQSTSIAFGVGIFVLNALVVANMSLSYYCATPTQITLNSGIGQQAVFDWGDVKSVRALCWRSGPRGRGTGGGIINEGLILTFSNGSHVLIRPGMGGRGPFNLAGDYYAIHSALFGHSYQFEISNPSLCSHQYFFEHWQS